MVVLRDTQGPDQTSDVSFFVTAVVTVDNWNVDSRQLSALALWLLMEHNGIVRGMMDGLCIFCIVLTTTHSNYVLLL